MTPEMKAVILAHARAEYPRESCGLILNIDGMASYRPCKNIAERQCDFIMDPVDYMKAEDEAQIIAIVHSHCDVSPKPSPADLVGCERSGLPWHIVSVPQGTWAYLEPSGYVAPLIGRPYSIGVLDCYSLIQDFYMDEFRQKLPDFERSEMWWKKGQNLYMDHFKEAGFEEVDGPMMRGDIIIMQIGSKVPNHAAVYLLEKNWMLHHLMNRLSAREIYGGYWQKVTRLVVRSKLRE